MAWRRGTQRLQELSWLSPPTNSVGPNLENLCHRIGAPACQMKGKYSTHTDGGESDSVREELLERALHDVPQFGFSRKSLEAAAGDLSLSKACAGAIKPAEIVHYFNSIANAQLERILEDAEKTDEWQHDMTLHEKLAFGVGTRLQLLEPYKSTWSSALAAQAYYDEASSVVSCAEQMLNSIWKYANGEKGSEVDMTWYTRRIMLGAIVQAAEVYMLTDESPDLQDTKIFVDRALTLFLA